MRVLFLVLVRGYGGSIVLARNRVTFFVPDVVFTGTYYQSAAADRLAAKLEHLESNSGW